MEGEDAETTTRYVCSACGYARGKAESVVKHIDSRHAGNARVMEYDAELPRTRVAKLLRQIEEWLE